MTIQHRLRGQLRNAALRLVRRSPLWHWSKGVALADLLKRTNDMQLAMRLLETNRFRRAVRPDFVVCPSGERLLVLAPHQDDDIIGAGGVLLHSVQRGKSLQCVYVTDGATNLPGHTKTEVAAMRREEAKQVWSQLGGPEPIFWDLPCNGIELSQDNGRALAQHINDFRPDVLFVPFLLEDPDDHRKVNHLLWLASQMTSLPDMEVWAYQVTSMIAPNIAVDISDVMDHKYHLMTMWESQNQLFDYPHQAKGMNAANTLYYKGTHALETRPKYVELFLVTPLSEYTRLLDRYYGAGSVQQIYG